MNDVEIINEHEFSEHSFFFQVHDKVNNFFFLFFKKLENEREKVGEA